MFIIFLTIAITLVGKAEILDLSSEWLTQYTLINQNNFNYYYNYNSNKFSVGF